METNPKEEPSPKPPEAPKEGSSSHQGFSKILNAVRGYYDEAVDGFRDAKSRLGEENKEEQPEPMPQLEPEPELPPVMKDYRPEPKGLHRQAPRSTAESDIGTPEALMPPSLRPMQTKEIGFRYRNVLMVGGMDFLGASLVHQLNLGGVEDIVVADTLNENTARSLPFLRFQEFLGPEELHELAATKFRGLPSFSHIFQIGGWNTANLAVAKSLYAAALKSGTRFISVASASSIGPRRGTIPQESWSQPTTFRPQSQEGHVSALFDRYALPKSVNKSYLSLKHSRLFGPGERSDDGIYGLVKSCYHQICSTGEVRLPSALRPGTPEGNRAHDFCYVLDAARVAVLLPQSPHASGVYELGSGNSCTAAAMAETVFSALGLPPSIQWDDSLPFAPPSSEPETIYLQRVTELGLPPSPDNLAEGVSHYIATYLQTGLDIGEDIPMPEPSPLPAPDNKTPIL
ncbi:MAG: NAD-dependent epimerase/dehydratase family protein, partial [Terrimicrobiaceae bacterium]